MMDSDSSSVISTSYSVDKEIVIHLERLRQVRAEKENILCNKRKEQFENFAMNNIDDTPFNLEGIHFYTFDHLKIKFGFNPSEVAHVTRKIKFVRYSNRSDKEIHSFFVEWSINHEKFRKNKIQRYRAGIIEFFDLDSEDEELHMDQEERYQLKLRRERILKRMIPPKRRIPPKTRHQPEITRKRHFELSPNIHLDSD
ncbi:hypothetical protein WA026_023142 [Henosepilachna vigintioctopunctata]|uniref:Uncharacterized protein n=1 Tax=Henosepilachna vigintioctopunctata TaxID=420089 RepID=A0AAW1U0U0_9CUCU